MCIKCANFSNKNKGNLAVCYLFIRKLKQTTNSTTIDSKVRDLNSKSGINEDSSRLNYSTVSIGKQFPR